MTVPVNWNAFDGMDGHARPAMKPPIVHHSNRLLLIVKADKCITLGNDTSCYLVYLNMPKHIFLLSFSNCAENTCNCNCISFAASFMHSTDWMPNIFRVNAYGKGTFGWHMCIIIIVSNAMPNMDVIDNSWTANEFPYKNPTENMFARRLGDWKQIYRATGMPVPFVRRS